MRQYTVEYEIGGVIKTKTVEAENWFDATKIFKEQLGSVEIIAFSSHPIEPSIKEVPNA